MFSRHILQYQWDCALKKFGYIPKRKTVLIVSWRRLKHLKMLLFVDLVIIFMHKHGILFNESSVLLAVVRY